MHTSIATIDSPEFINLQPVDLNPLMSSCEIKVLYIGENRNHSYITKEVATEMAKTLRGAPIVGYFREDKGDFADHGEKITLDDQGIKFECMTKPYGFVTPDARVWFQTFEDHDEFGETVKREYLMTTGYLWTGQFEECADVVNSGRPHSMELDENTLQGHWSQNIKSGIDFFIINDAIFSKLCILGDDVEPCFEGSSVTSPKVSSAFSLDDTFKQTLYTMMQDLKNLALEGGQHMDNLENVVAEEVVDAAPVAEVEEEVIAEFTEEVTESETVENVTEEVETEFEAATDQVTEEPSTEEAAASEYKKDKEETEDESPTSEDETSEDKAADEDKKKKEDEDTKKKYALLASEYTELQAKYSDLESRYNELVEFTKAIEDAKKDELIKNFYMLSDEDKKDVIENKSNYSYDEIKAKLSVLYVEKTVNFNLENNSKNEDTVEDEDPIVTFNLTETESSAPAWISALKNARKND